MRRSVIIILIAVLGLVACGPPPTETPLPTFALLPTVTPMGAEQTATAAAAAVATVPPIVITATRPPSGPLTPVVGPNLTGTPLPTTTPCLVDSEFITDVSIPDGTVVQIGRRFTKTWRILNTGTCAWDSGFRFQKIDGVVLNVVEAEVLLPFTLPGEEADISVTLVIPLGTPPGEYRARFQIAAPDGSLFGARPFVVVDAVPPGEGIEPTNTPSGSASIAGAVWGDAGDGNLDDGEPRIGGITLRLLSETCETEGGAVLGSSTTDSLGTYRFDGLAAGNYCVVIDPYNGSNVTILIPGQWVVPSPLPDSQNARISVTIGEGEERTGINFGWMFANP